MSYCRHADDITPEHNWNVTNAYPEVINYGDEPECEDPNTSDVTAADWLDESAPTEETKADWVSRPTQQAHTSQTLYGRKTKRLANNNEIYRNAAHNRMNNRYNLRSR